MDFLWVGVLVEAYELENFSNECLNDAKTLKLHVSNDCIKSSHWMQKLFTSITIPEQCCN